MLKFFKKMKKNRKGYTLTELIVVVAILGILAAIATPMIMNQVGRSRTTAEATSAKAIETAVQLCLADGTLLMSDADSNAATPDIITAPSSTIPLLVRAKLVGDVYPNHAVTDTNQWALNLNNGEVTSVANTVISTGTVVILD